MAKPSIEQLSPRHHDFIGTRSIGLIPLPAGRFASASRNDRSCTNDLAVGCRLPSSQHQIVDCETPIRAAILPPLKPALVLPRASKRLTMGRSAEGEIKPACRLVPLRSEAAAVSSLG